MATQIELDMANGYVRDFGFFYNNYALSIHNAADQFKRDVAQSMLEAYGKGENSSLWHNVAKVAGHIDQCQCWTCCKQRKE